MSAILGLSGLAESVRFKRAHWPGLDEREYRILQGFDAAAALVVDGQVVAAAAEERFNRNKQMGDFPSRQSPIWLSKSRRSSQNPTLGKSSDILRNAARLAA